MSVNEDTSSSWTIKDYSERYARLALRFQEQTEELIRTRAALVASEAEALRLRTERRIPRPGRRTS